MSTVELHTERPQPRHKWPQQGEDGYSRKLHTETTDGNERIERVCRLCGMTRITVIPPRPHFPWHEWRIKSGRTFQCEATPPCREARP